MSACRVDLYLGGALGGWALQFAMPANIGLVFTPDAETAQYATEHGFKVAQNTALDATSGAARALSVHYPKILPAELLAKYSAAYNLHPGYLPWGRGYFPAFWALFEGTPAGASLHQMTERLDDGPIVDQIKVPYTEEDTGGTLHERVRRAEMMLFRRHFKKICRGEPLPARPQAGAGSYHALADFMQIKRPEEWKHLSAQDLFKRIRCLTFPGFTGLELPLGERLIHLRMQDVD